MTEQEQRSLNVLDRELEKLGKLSEKYEAEADYARNIAWHKAEDKPAAQDKYLVTLHNKYAFDPITGGPDREPAWQHPEVETAVYRDGRWLLKQCRGFWVDITAIVTHWAFSPDPAKGE